jgi:acyl transferase domain-containing protein/3-hydroxymyristoyl/3-hydroxydecanoyl-(acyl carrier protein) dehydratase
LEPRIAIVGLGGLFPTPDGAAATPECFWANVLGAVDASREAPPDRWLIPPDEAFAPGVAVADHVYSKRGYFLGDFTLDMTGLDVSRELMAQLDPLFHLTLAAGKQAFLSAKTMNLNRQRVGVILGNIQLPTDKASALAREVLGPAFEQHLFGDKRSPRITIEPLNRYVAGLPAGLLAKALGLGGGSFTLDAACASSLYALKLAADELRAGRADAMLAGGVSRPDCLYTQMGFAQLRALSTSGRCHPFDARASGLVVGEGAGIFVLKRLDDAERDGDCILAVIAGIGLSNDVGGSLLAPSSEGQLRAMRQAYEQAGWSPHDIDLIECHATGTPVGDGVEFQSLKTLWGPNGWRRGQCVIGSVKSTVGHLLTAAGAAGVTKIIHALRDGKLPPTANYETPAPGLEVASSPFRILTQAEDWNRRADRPRRAAISAFGFGGINAHVLLEEYAGIAAWGLAARTAKPQAAQPVAIIAMGAHFGPWSSLRAVRERVLGGAPVEPQPPRHWWGVSDMVRFTGYYVQELQVSLEQFRIPPRELQEMLPQQLLMLQVAARVLDAVALPDTARARTGVFIGLGLDLNTTNFHFRWSMHDAARRWATRLNLDVMEEDFAAWVQALRDAAGPALNANRTMGALGSIAASRIAREFHFGGPSFTVAAEENSGIRALEVAVRALQRGELDYALVGAVDLAGDVRAVLATDAHRPYSPSGAPVGEGAAAFVLKRLDDAVRDGDTIQAVIKGIGVVTATGAEAAHAAQERACADANVPPASVHYVETEDDTATTIGHCGAALGLASLVKACLALKEQVLKRPHQRPRFWLRDRVEGPRRAGVRCVSVDGNCTHVVLEEWPTATIPATVSPLGDRAETLFVVEGRNADELLQRVQELRRLADVASSDSPLSLGRQWHRQHPLKEDPALAVAFVARNHDELREQLDWASQQIVASPQQALPVTSGPAALRDRVFYSPQPLGLTGQIAFVYPGSGNDFADMGRDLAVRWPHILRQQDEENEYLCSQYVPQRFWSDDGSDLGTTRERIFGQVALGTLVTDLVRSFGVRADAAIGYSLGESAMLFSLRAWTARDRMLRMMNESPLFATDLCGRCDAARKAWKIPANEPIDWLAGLVDRAPEQVRLACANERKVYLFIINTRHECVIGGDRNAVERVIQRLGCQFLALPDATTVHCAVAREVAEAYRELHRLPVTPPPGVRFYSTALGRAYDINDDSAAEAILAQALDTVDYPATIEATYRDGVRIFLEMGPGSSCSRMIGAILGERPHRARSACTPGADAVGTLLRLLAQLAAELVPLNLDLLYGEEEHEPAANAARSFVMPVGGEPFRVPPLPPNNGLFPGEERCRESAAPSKDERHDFQQPPVRPCLALRTRGDSKSLLTRQAGEELSPLLAQTVTAYEAYSNAHAAFLRYGQSITRSVASNLAFQTTLLESLVASNTSPTVALNREQCLEFAVGSIANVLGPEFAPIDAHPTRVRLPDEPLMLVDRILTIEGEPRSLTSGRVVTEHDIHLGAWYLDAGRIPTCITVEAGQADLFLSGYLGIDFETKGLAAYRLLDASVTFHRGLPGPGEIIRYDIHIDRFFRQGDTHLFRFRFEGTVNGEPLLTMRDGCAGFFTEEALAAGKGVVQTALQRRPQQGVQPDDGAELPPMAIESYDDAQIDALRRGDLATCFGPLFTGLTLHPNLWLPGGRMKLVDRVLHLDPKGGRYGIGLIRAEADIDPEAWFLTCHFVDDRVMPGTLMYECCLHTLRIYLLRLGWVCDAALDSPDLGCDPVPGIASQLKCRGQVIASTKKVVYEIILKERGYRPEPYAIVDALMYADGKPIVEITNMTIRLTGLTRETVAATWRARNAERGMRNELVSRSALRAPRSALFDKHHILAFAVGKPSEGFGEPYRVFDEERTIARLPGPPYQFLDRIVSIDAEPWQMVPGGVIEAEYDVPPDAWYFQQDRQPVMPFAVLLETALQPCGWMAAFMGSALTSPTDLRFRNLGGTAGPALPVRPDAGTLTTRVKVLKVASSGGMIIQSFAFEIRNPRGDSVYKGETTFGFFSKEALAQQVGIRDAKLYEPDAAELTRARSFEYPRQAPYSDDRMRMLDRIDVFVPDGGPQQLGFLRGSKRVVPEEWFFKAHFFQDPVWPGSLGLEAFLQLFKVAALERWGGDAATWFEMLSGPSHTWMYRGQVIPTNETVTVQAVMTACDDATRTLTADGFLSVDGRTIYQMTNFTIRVH